ncbi:MAG: RNA-binding protein [Planctomycetes bacterium]|nr:RNA-binding protein [Planctomycetota bacterium]
MTSNIYVGSLSYQTTEDELRQLFEQFGEVSSAKVITDRDTGRSKGFGFVEMATQEAAEEAIKQLNGTDLGGRNIVVNQARPKKKRF